MSCCKKQQDTKQTGCPALALDEALAEQMKKGDALMGTLINPLDVEICSKILRMCKYYHGFCDLAIKENINKFMDYFIKLLWAHCKQQPLFLYKQWFREPRPIFKDDHTVALWMQPNKNYLASTKLSDGSFIFYFALARTFHQKWAENGLATIGNINK